MPALYRIHRPKTFAEVVGQDHAITTITREIVRGAVAHAYLLVGPRGTGKTTIARLIARSLNCTKRATDSAEPCNSCDSCAATLRERNMDVIEIDAATHTQVDNVRDVIIASANVPPAVQTGSKVFIIDEVHMLSRHAFNALLKTIEEPPARVVFILATTDVQKVPETIISRCERFDLRLLSHREIVERLTDLSQRESLTVSQAVIAGVARAANGSLRDAESIFGQLAGLAVKNVISDEDADTIVPSPAWETASDILTAILDGSSRDAITAVRAYTESGRDPSLLVDDCIELAREAMLLSINPDSSIEDSSERERATALSQKTTTDRLQGIISTLAGTSDALRLTRIPELPLEVAIVKLSGAPKPSSESGVAASGKKADERSDSKSDENAASLPLDRFVSIWPQLVDGLKEHNHSLSMFLKVAHPITLSADGTLTIGFRYDFHAATVRDPKNKATVETLLSSLAGTNLRIDCILDPGYSINHKKFQGSEERDVKDIIDVLGGGEIV